MLDFILPGFSLVWRNLKVFLRCDFYQDNKAVFSFVLATAYCLQTDSSESVECGWTPSLCWVGVPRKPWLYRSEGRPQRPLLCTFPMMLRGKLKTVKLKIFKTLQEVPDVSFIHLEISIKKLALFYALGILAVKTKHLFSQSLWFSER